MMLSGKQEAQFARYFKLLVSWNEKINLTAITAEDDVYVKHFYDCLTAGFYYDFSTQNIVDIGAGAGFPSIPLKIMYPDLQVTIIDSLNKRIKFLTELAEELQLVGVSFCHDRAENAGQSATHREKYDVVMARAVARMSVLSELCLPFVRQGGNFIALKGAETVLELKEAEKAIAMVGGKLVQDHQLRLPVEGSERHIVQIKKVKLTPKKYPRKAGIPNKQPIQ
ncbi:16S rRNA (guanine(527)-N(7))-methyltransferase RsmG [Bacillus sp. FSL W7-1360]|nr:16S rRNA (guanine(527)-N(7))-methyltransferase RsmG [Shouchella lonarensis]